MRLFRRKTKVEIRGDLEKLGELEKALKYIKKMEKEYNCKCTLSLRL